MQPRNVLVAISFGCSNFSRQAGPAQHPTSKHVPRLRFTASVCDCRRHSLLFTWSSGQELNKESFVLSSTLSKPPSAQSLTSAQNLVNEKRRNNCSARSVSHLQVSLVVVQLLLKLGCSIRFTLQQMFMFSQSGFSTLVRRCLSISYSIWTFHELSSEMQGKKHFPFCVFVCQVNHP